MMGRFDEEQWRKDYQGLFATHDLIHNHRHTVKIEVAPTEDAAFAVVDIDTLWRNKETGKNFHWKGRVCKIYSKLRTGEWKFYWQTSALNFPIRQSSSGA
jgi:ketosteroid isomerase-like protein